MSGFPYTFTFYSFKGGVGRSLAALNCAYALASRGRQVLLIDMDLEAPGLSGYLHRERQLRKRRNRNKGILDLLTAVKPLALQRVRPGDAVKELPSLSAFRSSVKPSCLKKPRLVPPGRLDTVVVNETEDYWQRLAELGLSGITRDDLARMGLILRHYLHQQRVPLQYPAWREIGYHEDVPYDYILIDSRTGITEFGGLCVGPLSDRLVVFSGLNDQNVNGTRAFFKETGIKPTSRRQSKDFEPWDEADPSPGESESPKMLGPKPTLIVASPVPMGEMELKAERQKRLEKSLGPVSASLSYHPRAALMESIFVRDYPEEPLSDDYHQLTDRLMASVSDHEVQLARRSSEAFNERKDQAGAIETVLRIAGQNASTGQSLLIQLGNAVQSDTERTNMFAIALHSTLLQARSDFKETALNNWGNALADQARRKEGEEADSLFEQAFEKYAESVRHKPDMHEAWYNWGNALAYQARRKEGEEADSLFAQARKRYEKSLQLAQTNDVLFNLACLAALQQQTKKAISWLRQLSWDARTLRSAIREDEDFDPIRDTTEFQAFLESLETQEK